MAKKKKKSLSTKRQILISQIKKADEELVNIMLCIAHDYRYSTDEPVVDEVIDLQKEFKKNMKRRRKDSGENRTYTYEEVMEKVNEKFPSLDYNDDDLPF